MCDLIRDWAGSFLTSDLTPTLIRYDLGTRSLVYRERFKGFVNIDANHTHKMFLTHISGTLVLFLLIIATTLATLTRYTIPIPAETLILETRQQLNDMAAAYSMGTLDDRNGGYYLLDHDGEILAVAADGLCEELDNSMASARRVYEQHSRFDLYSGEVQEVTLQSHDAQLRRSGENSCSHPRCYTHALCETYSDCFVCSSSHHWCY
ncbi:unnamed protein product [Aspergillus oryzae RIB40]|uniref:DNA, SC026 n=1 Tax=Aspergillus oryzae (strain ATCC 42149 / RIB 40) TaxID=510516 RepID=Q2UF90_ASPOR|nr:unnamed protein product [Aspergillus oryzae RIB40]BAE59775.1 unnamed protein product [Aspergillus oryzae RIB40]